MNRIRSRLLRRLGAAALTTAVLLGTVSPVAFAAPTPDASGADQKPATMGWQLTAAPTQTDSAGTGGILIILDSSGSMADSDGSGTVKIEGAKAGIISLAGALPAGTPVGLMTYPDGSDCQAPIVRQMVRPLDKTSFPRLVAELPPPEGGTPTALALRDGVAHLKSQGFTDGTIVLVSDGESNCAEDPCQAAKDVAASGFQLTVNTVGFSISTAGEHELQCVAAATNGVYAPVEKAADLGQTLADLSRPTLAVALDYPRQQIPVTETRVQITASITDPTGLPAHDVRVSLVSDVAQSDHTFAIVSPVRYLGNVNPGEPAHQVTWSITPSQAVTGSRTVLTFAARSTDAATVTQELILTFGELRPGTLEADSAFHGMQKALVLGDSYSSGEGADSPQNPYQTEIGQSQACHRSKNQYAGRIFGSADVTILACSGAIASNITDNGQNEPSQLDQLADLLDTGYRPDVVFLSIGGNDVGFADLVKECVIDNLGQTFLEKLNLGLLIGPVAGVAANIASRNLADCHTSPENLPQYQDLGQKLKSLSANLPTVYARVAGAFAGRSIAVPPIVVLPYPIVVPLSAADRGQCSKGIFQSLALSLKQLDDFLKFELTLDAVVQQAVQTASGQGIPVYYAADVAWALQPGHTVCADQQWVNALTAAGSASGNPEMLHPNVEGHRSMAVELIRWSQTAGLTLTGATLPPPAKRSSLTQTINNWITGAVNSVPLSASSGTGQTVTIKSGSTTVIVDGVAPGSTVTVQIKSETVPLGSGVADENGRLALTVPLDGVVVPLGEHQLQAWVTTAAGDRTLWSQTIELREPLPMLLWILLAVAAGLALLGVIFLILRRVRLRRDQRTLISPT